MISDPDLVLYACIAHNKNPSNMESSTILAEFNSADSPLQELAHECLQFVPPYHSIFSHTFRHQTYTFLLNDGFVYFGIFDYKVVKSDQVRFLTRLKEAISILLNGKSSFKFSSFCFQSEFHPIFHKLIAKSIDFDELHLVPNGVHHHHNDNSTNLSNSILSKSKKILSVSMISPSKGLKKKKLSGDSLTNSRDALVDGKVDLHDDYDDVDEVKSREFNHHHQYGNYLMDGGVVGKHKAKRIWRRHVWIVLVMDLVVCLILFGIWLFVCRGLQCIEG